MSIPIIILLAVVAILLILIAFVLFSPLWVKVKYEEGLYVVAGLGFIRFKLCPRDRTKPTKKNESKASSQQTAKQTEKVDKKQEQAKEEKTEKAKKGSVLDTLSLVLDILKSVLEMLGKSAKIEIDCLKCVVSRPDAADTAVYFGLCSGVVSTILALCSNFGKCKINNDNVGTSMDFVSGKSSIEADITLSARTVSVLSSLIKGYITNLMKK